LLTNVISTNGTHIDMTLVMVLTVFYLRSKMTDNLLLLNIQNYNLRM